MEVTINGKKQPLDPDQNLHDLIQGLCQNPATVIAEVNEKIVKRDNWEDFSLKSGDHIELVTFVGGG